MILAGDVGATKILLEVGAERSGRFESAHSHRFPTAEATNFSAVLGEFLREWEKVRRPSQRITAAAFGVAGPAQGNKVKMTHRPWSVDGDAIAARFKIAKVRVVNDLAAVAQGIDAVEAREIVTLQAGKASPSEPRVVMGVGTGLGIGYLVPAERGGYRSLSGEGGHMGFAPGSPAQAELWRYVFSVQGRCSAEEVASGRGLNHIYDFVRGGGKPVPGTIHAVTADWLVENAARGDAECVSTLELFAECLGNVAGDHALAVFARGGVYLAGGVVTRTLPALQTGRFREFFCAKSPHAALMMKIPVRAVMSDRVGVLGAAKLVSGTT